MLSYIRPGDNMWDVPVVLFCMWTVVLVVASLIVLSCLRRETKKFKKRLSKANSKEDLVGDIAKLDSIMARYVQECLGQGIFQKLADSNKESQLEILRTEAKQWFAEQVEELGRMKLPEKIVKRTILSVIRAGLTKHPLDLRGSRRALEAAKIFLEVEDRKPKISSPDGLIINPNTYDRFVCPTIACQWMASKFLNLFSFLASYPTLIPLLFVFLSFLIWLYDCVTDVVIIQLLWSYRLPFMYPVNESLTGEEVILSYQTLTIDLYAPLLLLILLSSLMFSLLSCSCSRLADQYKLATMYAEPLSETSGQNTQDPTTILARYDFQVTQAVTASLPQFCLQFSSYMVIMYMLETLAGLSVDKATQDTVREKIESFPSSSLWFSGLGSALSLTAAQYTALKIQHEHGLTLGQRIIYVLSCIFNTIAMMVSSVVFITLLILPVSTYVGHYHIMIIVILLAAILILGILICVTLAFCGLDPAAITTDRVVTRFQTENLLTAFLRFSQAGSGQWVAALGASALVGKLFSQITINLFLPPSQLLIHPFCKFYSTSPRSPALHYAIAKQLIYYNILLITSSILLCVDINEYGFNYNISFGTKNLLIFANFTCVPCIFMALLLLFKFYSSCDIWTSNGVHLVFCQDLPTISDSPLREGYDASWDEKYKPLLVTIDEDEEDSNHIDEDATRNSESDVTSNEETTLTEEQNESTEADRNHVTKKKIKIPIIKQTIKLNIKKRNSCCSLMTNVAVVDVHGKWVNVSD